MPNVVKKSVSFEKDLFDKLQKIIESSNTSFSSLICDAAKTIVDQWEMSQLEAAYKRYYAKPRPHEKSMNSKYLKAAKKTLKSHASSAH
jgi:metal-responsive CopG/Arc/MetJ family transcriptional regulator